MRIGIVGTRLAGVDGVTFETAKWEAVLEQLGHEMRLVAGELDALRSNARLIPPMHFTYPPAARCRRPPSTRRADPGAVRGRSSGSPASCCRRCATGERTTQLDVLSSRTPGPSRCTCRWAWPCAAGRGNRAAGHRPPPRLLVGARALRDRIVPDMLAAAFPPDLPNVRHVSINWLAAAQLRGAAGPRVGRGPERLRLRPAAAATRSRSRVACAASSAWATPAARRPADARRAAQGHRAGDRARRPAGGSGRACCSSPAPPATRGWSTSSSSSGWPTAGTCACATRPTGSRRTTTGPRDQPRPLTLRRVPRRRPDHLPEPLRGLRQCAGGGALLRLAGGREPIPRLRRRHPPARAAVVEIDGAITDADRRRGARGRSADPARRAAIARHNFAIGREHLGYDVLRRATAEAPRGRSASRWRR